MTGLKSTMKNNLLKNSLRFLSYFINLVSVFGFLCILDAGGSYITGIYSTGKYGRINPGDLGGYLSLFEALFGLIFVIIGVYYKEKSS